MGGVRRRTLDYLHLLSSAVPLVNITLKTYFQVLLQAALTSYFVKEKDSAHVLLKVFFKIIETKQACLKSCFSEYSQRLNILFVCYPVYSDSKQQKPCNFK